MAKETEQTRGTAQHRLLITLNRITAVLSILAAILLYTGEKTLGLPGLAAAPYHEPIIVHCLLTALLLFSANWRLAGEDGAGWSVMIIRSLALFSIAALAVIDLCLAGKAVLNFDLTTAFAILLAMPGLLCGWSYFALIAESDEESADENGDPDTGDDDFDAGDQVYIAVAQTQSTPGLTLRVHLRYGFAYVVVYGVIFIILAASFPYYYLIRRAIFDQQFFGWTSFLQALPASMMVMLPYFIALAVVLFGIYAWSGVSKALRERRDQKNYRDFNRELTADELFLIESAAHQLADYARNFRYRWLYNLIAFLIFFLTSGLFVLVGFQLIDDQTGLGASLLESVRTSGLDWYLYIDEFGAGDALALFSVIMVSGAILSLLGSVWRNLGNAGILEYREDSESTDDPWSYYWQAAALEVRRGRLTSMTAFIPMDFIHEDYKRFIRVWYIATGAVVLLNLAFLYLDRMDYDLLADDYIETTDYWTSRVHRFGYDDVDRAEVACALEEDDDEDERDLELSYRLKFADDRIIRAISLDTRGEFRSILPERLDPWTRVDAKLRAAGVPVVHAVRTVKGRARSDFDEKECIAGLDELVGPEVRKKVMPLLRESRGGRLSTGPAGR